MLLVSPQAAVVPGARALADFSAEATGQALGIIVGLLAALVLCLSVATINARRRRRRDALLDAEHATAMVSAAITAGAGSAEGRDRLGSLVVHASRSRPMKRAAPKANGEAVCLAAVRLVRKRRPPLPTLYECTQPVIVRLHEQRAPGAAALHRTAAHPEVPSL